MIQQPERPLTAVGDIFLLCSPAELGDLTWKNLERLAGPLPPMPILVDMQSGDLWLRFRLPEGVSTPMRQYGDGLWLLDARLAPNDLRAWLDEGAIPELPLSWRLNFRSLDIGSTEK